MASATTPPADVLNTIQQVFNADATAQVTAGNTAPATLPQSSMTSSAIAKASAQIAQDQGAAQYTAGQGFSWGSVTTTISDSSITSQTSTTMQVAASVTETFHITGTPDDGQGTDVSASRDDYNFTFTLGSDGSSWILSQYALQPVTDDTGTGTGQVPGPTASPSLSGGSESPPASGTVSGTYDRNAAWNWAWLYWWRTAPGWTRYGNDCQNYASQILYAGGVQTDGPNSWLPGWPLWINVSWFLYWAWDYGPFQFYHYISNLQTGDVIQVNWTGGNTPNHTIVVVDKSGNVILYTGHTKNRWKWPITYIYYNFPYASYWALHVAGTSSTRY